MHSLISWQTLVASNPISLSRLARSLYINVDGMTHLQIVNCVHSRLMSPPLVSPKQRSEYVMLWENLTA